MKHGIVFLCLMLTSVSCFADNGTAPEEIRADLMRLRNAFDEVLKIDKEITQKGWSATVEKVGWRYPKNDSFSLIYQGGEPTLTLPNWDKCFVTATRTQREYVTDIQEEKK